MKVLILALCALCACGNKHRATAQPETRDTRLGKRLAETIIAMCPRAERDSAAARAACAGELAKSSLMRESLAEPLLWGGQKPGTTVLEDSDTTRFNPFAWRKMYLSLGMYGPHYRVETVGERTVVHLPMQFRNALDAGAYPYPFWHAKAKWDSYNYSTELLLFIEDSKVIGALRSQAQDRSRPYAAREFDGNWMWQENGEQMPWVTLYQNLFSPDNAAVPALDKAYRELEEAMRPYACMRCHSPDNLDDQSELELFSYPNQALQSRHRLVAILEDNEMPPAEREGSTTGIADPQARAKLIELAKRFEVAADAALRHEGERVD